MRPFQPNAVRITKVALGGFRICAIWTESVRSFRRRIAIAAALIAICTVWAGSPSEAKSADTLEQQVKAAYLFKFGGYIEWPVNAFSDVSSPLIIGIYGDDSLAGELERTVANRTINGRVVVVQRLRVNEPIPKVHILYLGRTQLVRLPDIGAALRSALIVTDEEKGLPQGAIINFVVSDNRVRFEVSVDAAKRGGLKIGAPLLSVAMRVQG